MNSKTLPIMVVVLAVTLLFNVKAGAQSDDRIRKTWNGPDASLITSILKNREDKKSLNGTAKPRLDVVRFNPVGDSGVTKSLAAAFGRTNEEKAALTEAFGQIKQGYEAEVAKEGKSNNLAAAMTYFITVNVAANHQIDIPADEVGENLFQSLQETMTSVAAFAQMSNLEKQQMHDWLVCMAGFVLTGYADAKQSGDKESLKNFSQLADYSMRLVLGVEVGKLRFTGNHLSIEGANSAPPQPDSTGNKIAGVWSKSASSPAGSNLVTNAGYYKGNINSNRTELMASKPNAGTAICAPKSFIRLRRAALIRSLAIR